MVTDFFEFDPVEFAPCPGDHWPDEDKRRSCYWKLRSGGIELRGRRGKKFTIDAVPSAFLEPVLISRLPNPSAFRRVLKFHSFGMIGDEAEDDAILSKYLESRYRGLIVFGGTQTGKTRSVFARLIQLHVWRETDFRWISALDLANKVGANGNYARDEIFDQLAHLDGNLFIDDLDLPKFNTRYAEELYRLIDRRVADRLPVVATMRTIGNQFVERVAGKRNFELIDIARAIVGRLREACDSVDFDFETKELQPERSSEES